MNRAFLLKELAGTGYSVGYAAKKHFATYDILEKAPGWIALLTLAIGIFALVVPALEGRLIAASILVVGIAALYFNSYQDSKSEYAKAGKRLTSLFTDLRAIYYDARGRDEADDVADLELRYREILADSQGLSLSKQIFLSDWYAHYKFFWQSQTGWLDEQLEFRFWRDKVPLTATVAFALVLVAAALRLVQTGICSAGNP